MRWCADKGAGRPGAGPCRAHRRGRRPRRPVRIIPGSTGDGALCCLKGNANSLWFLENNFSAPKHPGRASALPGTLNDAGARGLRRCFHGNVPRRREASPDASAAAARRRCPRPYASKERFLLWAAQVRGHYGGGARGRRGTRNPFPTFFHRSNGNLNDTSIIHYSRFVRPRREPVASIARHGQGVGR